MTKTTKNENGILTETTIDGEVYLKISDSDEMRPFFMSIVSFSNHWMFISSNGGLTAGRKNSEFALFPYYTDDKITESSEITGSKSIFLVTKKEEEFLWEPFSERQSGVYKTTRNLYKNKLGNKVLFEEINHDLSVTFKYQWNSSDKYGFVRKSYLVNNGKEEVSIKLVDGIQNILPYGVGSFLQNQSSNLVDAYKRNQIEKESGLGIYALSAIIVDKAEPSEALKANIAYSLGLEKPTILLSSLQLANFRKGDPIREEVDIKAEKGAYFVSAELVLKANSTRKWLIIADVNKNHAEVASKIKAIKTDAELHLDILADIERGNHALILLNAGSDGLQKTADQLRDTRHFANTLFNIMRGGIFDDNYSIHKWDICNYLSHANLDVFQQNEEQIQKLPEIFNLSELQTFIRNTNNIDLQRLCIEYMPLKFSRRHGDPSRPWNKFSINTQNEDGTKILDYQGNWRDIFQNWEALALSYPDFIGSMIHKFLNATTFEGYNPYRVTKSGFDWESIEPDDPWSYIGYWGDHQIIYLLKLLEVAEQHSPGLLENYFDKEMFVYANVPYRIKSYQDILKNPKDTIDFDLELHDKIQSRKEAVGADGALLLNVKQQIHRANFVEKILVTLLAKLSNFIPEGGIWLNTQRPEWNDANNALVGNGVSMVTLYYMRRFMNFFVELIEKSAIEEYELSEEVCDFYTSVSSTLAQYHSHMNREIGDVDRKLILDELGKAGSEYRSSIYEDSFSGSKSKITRSKLQDFLKTGLSWVDHSIHKNKREDNLFHAYNLMSVNNNSEVSISYLNEMLEGQVAVLSSGYLTSKDALEVLDALKHSKLFRKDQYSYILYPNKDLPTFLEKNNVPEESVKKSNLLQLLVNNGDTSIILKDVNGEYHFSGNFNNANDLKLALTELSNDEYGLLLQKESEDILALFEQIFDHKSFTGRSGTFYGYEGLGSIYWHMVSKLLLAVQECCAKAVNDVENEEIVGRLLEHFYEITEGVGVHKPPSLYGAFPTDPYSHTPAGKGAQQPGMTGQVKEDILSRFGEFGVHVEEGKLHFDPYLLRQSEFLKEASTFDYIDIHGESRQIQLDKDSLAFTYCQVPIVYKISDHSGLAVFTSEKEKFSAIMNSLDLENSSNIFSRTGEIERIEVAIRSASLR